MDSTIKPTTEGGVRISDSPRHSPHVTHTITSPVRSIHPTLHMESLNSQVEMPMESLDSQADLGMRTADFFDGSSSDGEEDIAGTLERDASGVEANLIDRGRHSQVKRRESRPRAVPNEPQGTRGQTKGRSFQPEGDGYQRLSPVKIPEKGRMSYLDPPDTPSSSYNGSVTELLPGEEHGSSPPTCPRPARLSGFARPQSKTDPRSEPAYRSSSVMPPAPLAPVASKVDQILSAHAIAHEITLQSLMHDENTLDRTIESFASMADRGSIIAASLRFNDPRSPGTTRKFSAPDENGTQQPPATAASKRVHVLPPPIDTTQPRRSLPQNLIRTPYPEGHSGLRHKDLSHITSSVPNTPAPPANAESILTLSIRPSKPNNRRRVTTLTIPAPNNFSIAASSPNEKRNEHPQPFRTPDNFDDKDFFRQVQLAYSTLAGPWRHLSARTLKRIVVSGSASQAADAGYGWLAQPRSPRELAFKGLQDTFGGDKIWAQYRRPGMGKGRFAFVHWARRLAEAEGRDRSFREDGERDGALVRRLEQPEGLEFVMGWSVGRILGALGLVLVATLASVLLWVLLGPAGTNMSFAPSGDEGSGPVTTPGGGFRGAGDRVGGGVAMGICVLLVGLSSIAGWMGASWLVI